MNRRQRREADRVSDRRKNKIMPMLIILCFFLSGWCLWKGLVSYEGRTSYGARYGIELCSKLLHEARQRGYKSIHDFNKGDHKAFMEIVEREEGK